VASQFLEDLDETSWHGLAPAVGARQQQLEEALRLQLLHYGVGNPLLAVDRGSRRLEQRSEGLRAADRAADVVALHESAGDGDR
jgi:hypothetical protein